MEFCDQSRSSTNFAPKFYQIRMFFVTAKKMSSNLESLHFVDVFRKMSQMQNREERWSWKIQKW